MIRPLNIARRTSLTVAMAGAVAFGAVALAPAASAAQTADAPALDGGYTVVEKTNGNGPVAFLVDENGKKSPIFFCDPEKPNKRKSICQADPNAGEGRF
jgi:hypothetical protein